MNLVKEKIRSITIDLFGTLFDNSKALERAAVKSCSMLSNSIKPEALHDEWQQHLDNQCWHEGSFYLMRKWYYLALEKASDNLSISLPLDKCVEHLMQEMAHSPLYSEGINFLKDVQSKYKLYILSNIDDEMLEPILTKTGFAFSGVISSEAVESYKPNRLIFQEACRVSGCSAEEFLHIGDMPLYDIKGGKDAGFQTALIDRTGKHNDISCTADIIVNDLEKLGKHL